MDRVVKPNPPKAFVGVQPPPREDCWVEGFDGPMAVALHSGGMELGDGFKATMKTRRSLEREVQCMYGAGRTDGDECVTKEKESQVNASVSASVGKGTSTGQTEGPLSRESAGATTPSPTDTPADKRPTPENSTAVPPEAKQRSDKCCATSLPGEAGSKGDVERAVDKASGDATDDTVVHVPSDNARQAEENVHMDEGMEPGGIPSVAHEHGLRGAIPRAEGAACAAGASASSPSQRNTRTLLTHTWLPQVASAGSDAQFMLFLHGLGGDGSSFDRMQKLMRPHLPDSTLLVLLDLYGHGLSASPRPNSRRAQDLVDALLAQDWQRGLALVAIPATDDSTAALTERHLQVAARLLGISTSRSLGLLPSGRAPLWPLAPAIKRKVLAHSAKRLRPYSGLYYALQAVLCLLATGWQPHRHELVVCGFSLGGSVAIELVASFLCADALEEVARLHEDWGRSSVAGSSVACDATVSRHLSGVSDGEGRALAVPHAAVNYPLPPTHLLPRRVTGRVRLLLISPAGLIPKRIFLHRVLMCCTRPIIHASPIVYSQKAFEWEKYAARLREAEVRRERRWRAASIKAGVAQADRNPPRVEDVQIAQAQIDDWARSVWLEFCKEGGAIRPNVASAARVNLYHLGATIRAAASNLQSLAPAFGERPEPEAEAEGEPEPTVEGLFRAATPEYNFTNRAGVLREQCLFLWGNDDHVNHVHAYDKWKQVLPDSHLVVVPGEHVVSFIAPVHCAAAALKFLSGARTSVDGIRRELEGRLWSALAAQRAALAAAEGGQNAMSPANLAAVNVFLAAVEAAMSGHGMCQGAFDAPATLVQAEEEPAEPPSSRRDAEASQL